MTEPDIWERLSQFGLAGIFAGILGWIIYKVGLRMIAVIDKLAEKVDNHTNVDIEYHNEVQNELAALRSRIDTALELTPVEGHRRQTPMRGVPSGEYGFTRPKTGGR